MKALPFGLAPQASISTSDSVAKKQRQVRGNYRRQDLGDGICTRWIETLITKVLQSKNVTLVESLLSMQPSIDEAIATADSVLKTWQNLTEQQYTDKINAWAEQCGYSYIKCYTAEDPSIYEIVSGIFHDPDRMDGNDTSAGVKSCSPFQLGLHTECLSRGCRVRPQLWRGVRYKFTPSEWDRKFQHTTLSPKGQPNVCFYDPKSASTNINVAKKFAGAHGTLYLLLNCEAYELTAQDSFFPSEEEHLIPLLSLFRFVYAQRSDPDLIVLEYKGQVQHSIA